ncbi:ZIP family metal transporter [Heliorestis convoluta]|uniref:Zinc/iron permease, putative n=1 Tax=Heliorestis convoluta TaxID=356322 RepID=A0A5Q2N5Y3_9FIRM|nr:ZIP family metal transporter [Heliorestis convoluta]QGG49353.1 zinc/iron permease, putative [Heliorestis convoluta]
MGGALEDLIVPMLLLSFVAGFATTLGAFVVLWWPNLQPQKLSAFLGFASGVMIVVVALDLLPTAWQWGGLGAMATGFVMGFIVIAIADLLLTRLTRSTLGNGTMAPLRKMGYLIAIGISLHDFPEGIAIAAGAAAEVHLGWVVALAIGLHNIPEGIATAAPLRMSGLRAWKIILLTVIMSLFTPLGTLLGFGLLAISTEVLAQLIALAGGAMVYLVWDELWPEARKNSPFWAYTGALIGALCMVAVSFIHHH